MLLIHLFNLLIYHPLQFVITIFVIIIPLFMSIAFHEWAHGYVAYKFGDMTPKLQGRLTLNPLAHLDPIGTLMLFIIGIGWAKPIILNPLNYPNKTCQMLVAMAGPAMNILLAILFGFILVYLQIGNFNDYNGIIKSIFEPLTIIVRINLILAFFNLIPIPPLDCSRFVAWMLPEKIAFEYLALEPLGLMFVLIFLFAGGFEFILYSTNLIMLKLLALIKILLTSHILL